MSTNKSPLSRVKEQFGSKEKLVDALVGMPEGVFERNGQDGETFKKSLMAAANSKLLRLFDVGQSIKERFGSREKLVDALLTQMNRAKDGDYRNKLGQLSIARLFSQMGALEGRARKEKKEKKAAARS